MTEEQAQLKHARRWDGDHLVGLCGARGGEKLIPLGGEWKTADAARRDGVTCPECLRALGPAQGNPANA